jgi:ABC-type sugar transport system substrate-binding protein
MMKLTRYLHMLVIGILFAACVPLAPVPTLTLTIAPTPMPALKTYKDLVVGFLHLGSESGWGSANAASFKETAAKFGVTLQFYDSAMAPTKRSQVSGFRQFIADPDINVILLVAVEPNGWDDVLREAQAAGKVVILENRSIDAPENLYATRVSPDFVEEGRKAGRVMIELLKDSGKKNVVELVGSAASSAAKDRGVGFREAIQGSGIVITQSRTANWSGDEGKQVMETFLKQSQDIQGVFAQSDEMGLGAIEAIKEAGLAPGVDIKVISIDATSGAFKAMIAGELNAAVECNPLFAPQVYEAALKALNGEPLPKWIPTQETVFRSTDDNLMEVLKTRQY